MPTLIKNTYTGDGTTVLYTFTFPYLERTHVKVALNGSLITAFTFDNDTTIRFNTAPANGVIIEIFRQTPTDELQAVFSPGSAIRAEDLNDDFTQALYVFQELDTDNQTLTETVSQISTSGAFNIERVANVAAIPTNPGLNKIIEVVDSTGIQSFSPLTGLPSGFVGSSSLSPRLQWTGITWTWLDYKANDPDARYLTDRTYYKLYSNVAGLPASPTTGTLVEILDSTGVQSLAGLTGTPSGFTGSNLLSVRLIRGASNWQWVSFFPLNPDIRYWRRTETPSGVSGLSGSVLNILAVSDPNTPIGTIVWLQRDALAPPDGWLYCNGVDKQRAQYNALFNAIGTTYGAGDGTTTFGFPLEANLTNPFTPDTTYRPFIKFGTRTSEPGELFARWNNSSSILTAFINGTARGAQFSASGASGIPVAPTAGPPISADGLILSCHSTNTTGRNVYIWKRSGLSWSLVTANPAVCVAGQGTEFVAVSPDGNYVAVLATSPANNVYFYKANANKDVYTLIGNITLSGTAGGVGRWIYWSRSGNFLSVVENDDIWFISRSGDTFTETQRTPSTSGGMLGIQNVDFHPSDNFALAATNQYVYVFSRAGGTYSQLASYTRTTAVNGKPCFWNATGDRIVCGAAGGTPTTFALLSFNGTTLTQLQNLTTFDPRELMISKRSPNLIYCTNSNAIYSFSGDVLTSFGTVTPGHFAADIGGISSGLVPD
jgi:hypothetical protein